MNFFITGGNRGIGEKIVMDAAAAGHHVAFTYHRSPDRADQLVARCRDLYPHSQVRGYQLDVKKSSQVEQVAEQVLNDFESIEVVIPNAGINLNNLVVQMSDEEWDEVIATNLSGAFYVSRAFLQQMMMNRYGRIILMSSLGANGVSGQANYCASKAGLLGLSKALSKEYGKKGITSNVIIPGFFDTDMTRSGMSENNKKFWQAYCPVGRMGELNEISKLVLFLASKDSAFINGAEIPVTGGLDWAP